jgi:ATP-dependent Clp protease protease subunit
MSDNDTLDLPDLDETLARRLLEHRTLVLGSVLDERLGNRLCQALLLLAADDRHDDIQLWINSPGGSVSAMLAIRDVMRTIPNDVATVVTGTAYSAGQFLLHQGSGGIGGTAMDIAIQADDLRYTVETVIRIVAEDTGQAVETIERDSRRDRMFTAEQARTYGFVDQVITDFDQINPSRTRRTMGLGGTR